MIALMSHATGIRFAEVGYLLIVIAGVWIVAGEFSMKWAKFRRIVSGILLAAAGLLLIIATHWGAVS